MKYASRGASTDVDNPGPLPAGPMFDEDLDVRPPPSLLGPGGGDPNALLPWVDDIGPTIAPKPAVQGPPAPEDDHKLRLDWKNKELRAGNPDAPDDGFFLASAKEQGARWSTEGGGFTGKIDKSGLDTRAVLSERDQLHGTINAEDKSGALAWERDGKSQGELYGRYGGGDDWEAGLRRKWELGGGELNTGLRHKVTGEGGLTGIYGDYKSTDGKTAISGDAGVRNGQFVGGLTGSHEFTDTRKINGSLTQDESGTVAKLGGQYDNLTLDGNYKRTADGDTSYGLNGSYKLGDRGAINAGWTNTKDGNAFNLDGNYKLNDNTSVNGSFTHDKNATVGKLGGEHTWDGGSLSGSAEVAKRADGTTTTLAGAYKNGGLSLDGTFANGPDGNSLGLNGAYKFNDNTSINGAFAHDKTGTSLKLGGEHTWDGGSLSGSANIANRPDGWHGGLEGTYKSGKNSLTGSYTHTPEKDALNLSGAYQASDNWSLGGKLGYERLADGSQQGTLGLSEKYRSANLVHGIDLDAGVGTRNYLSATGSIDGRLSNNLYAGAWGNAMFEEGKRTTGQLGASMTYLPSDKTALTAAALMNDRGQMEARLELDLFKKGIKDTRDLVDNRKSAPVSLFLSYAQGGKRSMDDRYGAPQYDMGNSGNTLSAGVRFKF